MERQPTRSEYKQVWTALSDTHDRAKMHVSGVLDEELLAASGRKTVKDLQDTVGIFPDDVVLEIGCGVGRVGLEVAPLCRRWIGCDVSANMLEFAAERLRDLPNVELKEISGYKLEGISDQSVDAVYCTVVFMHLESWDRYAYVLEAIRVLKPRGRLYIDNVNICSDGGWQVFEAHRAFPPTDRPPHITECSTPQELETYLTRAGFRDINLQSDDVFVRAWGRKSAAP
jgi:ubiquinone/menaquinone biosynthesis C-methylase UbiE